MKNNINKKTLDSLSNALAYNIQDTFEAMINGQKFSVRDSEKRIKKMIQNFLKEE